MATKTERRSLRLTESQDAILRRAAEARGESTNDYILRHAVEAAEADLTDLRMFVANENEWNQIQAALAKPVAFNEAMVKLLTSPSVLE
jgi:uncharacterized protein (DUF1778 family)